MDLEKVAAIHQVETQKDKKQLQWFTRNGNVFWYIY
jgi:hypothetical protein